MATFAFVISSAGPIMEAHLGFSWGPADIHHTAVYQTYTASGEIDEVLAGCKFFTSRPVTIQGGFPGLRGHRVFLDIMGGVMGRSWVDIDLKIYERGGPQLLYQNPTLSVECFGFLSGGTVISTAVNQGGVVGDSGRSLENWVRHRWAALLGLLPEPSRSPVANDYHSRL